MAVQMLGTFLTLPLVTRLLTPHDYGVVVTALLVGQIVAIPAAAGVPAAAGRLFFEPDSGPRQARAIYLVTPLVAMPVCGLALVSAPLWTRLFGEPGLTTTLRFGVVLALPLACLGVSQSILLARRRSAVFGALAVFATVGPQIGGVVALSRTVGRPTDTYLAVVVAITALAAVLSAAAARVSLSRLPTRRLLRAAAVIGLPTVPHLLALQVIAGGDRAVIARTASIGDVGRYQVAYAVGAVGISFFGAFTQAVAPLIHAADDSDRWDVLSRLSALVHRLAALVVVALVAAVPLLLTALAPASYRRDELIPVASVIALVAMAYVGYQSAVNVLFELNRPAALSVIAPSAAIANIALNIVVVPVAGLLGAALVTLATYLYLAVAVALVASRMAKVPWRRGAFVASWAAALLAVTTGAFAPVHGSWIAVRVAVTVSALALAARPIMRVLHVGGGAAA
jgi:O-antigen/teichoic acid export membrane protein